MAPPSGATLLIAGDPDGKSLIRNDARTFPSGAPQALGQQTLLFARLLAVAWPHAHAQRAGGKVCRASPRPTTDGGHVEEKDRLVEGESAQPVVAPRGDAAIYTPGQGC